MRIIKIGKTKETNIWYFQNRWILEDREEEIRTPQFKLISPSGRLVFMAKPSGIIEVTFGSKYLVESVLKHDPNNEGYAVNLNGRRVVITKEEILSDLQEILGWKGFQFNRSVSEYMCEDDKAWGAFIVGKLAVESGRDDDSWYNPAGRSLLNC